MPTQGPQSLFLPKLSDLTEILKVDVIFARPVSKKEQNVNYNNKHLNLTTINVKVVKKHQKRQKCDFERWKTIPHWTRLAKPTQFQNGESKLKQ